MRGNGSSGNFAGPVGNPSSALLPTAACVTDFVPPTDTGDVRGEIVALLPRLRRFAFALTSSSEDADDLLHSSIERALSRLDQWQRGTRLDSWMYRIIQTVRIDQTRAKVNRQRHVPLDEGNYEVAAALSAEDTDATIILDKVLRAMSRLSEPDRAILALVCIDGMRYREAAEVLDVPVGTVMSRLARARRRLHELVYGPGVEAGNDEGDSP